MDGKRLRSLLALGALVIVIYLGLLWQPTRQVRLHQRHFLQAVEKRKWPRVAQFIAAEYRDRWGHDKENVITHMTQVFSQFLICDIQAEERSLVLADGAGTLGARLTLGGTGGPLAEMAKQEASRLTEPFSFKWAHRSWKPWDWELVEVQQSQLDIPDIPTL
ncbi:MAG TPA: hypothetical protein VFD27_23080 [Chthoniobacteraceae bacterium]|nr:hypothetical protein [Chthoniobacteraceae bacterium]